MVRGGLNGEMEGFFPGLIPCILRSFVACVCVCVVFSNFYIFFLSREHI